MIFALFYAFKRVKMDSGRNSRNGSYLAQGETKRKKCYVIPLKQGFLEVFNWETTKEVFLVKHTGQ